jgi:uncharacterized coiled-coil protein SlyX
MGMTQDEMIAKLAELEVCVVRQTETIRMLAEQLAQTQDSLALLIEKLTKTFQRVAR